MRWKVAVEEGGLIPAWHGIAYRDFDRNVKWAYPMPCHLIVRWVRDFRYWLKMVGRPEYRERHEAEMFHAGMRHAESLNVRHLYLLHQERAKNNAAYSKGWNDGINHVLKQLDR